MSVKQPVTQVRLTNIAVVRYRYKGKRFEIACFPNKVLDWRKKIEHDILSVLQSDTIFINVSKAEIASTKDLMEIFETADRIQICRTILDKGQLQISERERKNDLSAKTLEIVSYVTEICVHKETGRPIPVRTIENAMTNISYSVSLTKPSKQQALDVLRNLKDYLPLERIRMRIRLVIPLLYSGDLLRTFWDIYNTVINASTVTPVVSTTTKKNDNKKRKKKYQQHLELVDDGQLNIEDSDDDDNDNDKKLGGCNSHKNNVVKIDANANHTTLPPGIIIESESNISIDDYLQDGKTGNEDLTKIYNRIPYDCQFVFDPAYYRPLEGFITHLKTLQQKATGTSAPSASFILLEIIDVKVDEVEVINQHGTYATNMTLKSTKLDIKPVVDAAIVSSTISTASASSMSSLLDIEEEDEDQDEKEDVITNLSGNTRSKVTQQRKKQSSVYGDNDDDDDDEILSFLNRSTIKVVHEEDILKEPTAILIHKNSLNQGNNDINIGFSHANEDNYDDNRIVAGFENYDGEMLKAEQQQKVIEMRSIRNTLKQTQNQKIPRDKKEALTYFSAKYLDRFISDVEISSKLTPATLASYQNYEEKNDHPAHVLKQGQDQTTSINSKYGENEDEDDESENENEDNVDENSENDSGYESSDLEGNMLALMNAGDEPLKKKIQKPQQKNPSQTIKSQSQSVFTQNGLLEEDNDDAESVAADDNDDDDDNDADADADADADGSAPQKTKKKRVIRRVIKVVRKKKSAE